MAILLAGVMWGCRLTHQLAPHQLLIPERHEGHHSDDLDIHCKGNKIINQVVTWVLLLLSVALSVTPN
jgi:hypothetical protein